MWICAAERIEGRFQKQPLVEAVVRSTLGKTYHALGEYEKAEHQHQRAWQIRLQELGSEHPATLSSAYSVAHSLVGLGRYNEAEQLLRQVSELRLSVLGPEHGDTLNCTLDLAYTLFKLQCFVEAEVLDRGALKIAECTRGKEDCRRRLVA